MSWTRGFLLMAAVSLLPGCQKSRPGASKPGASPKPQSASRPVARVVTPVPPARLALPPRPATNRRLQALAVWLGRAEAKGPFRLPSYGEVQRIRKVLLSVGPDLPLTPADEKRLGSYGDVLRRVGELPPCPAGFRHPPEKKARFTLHKAGQAMLLYARWQATKGRRQVAHRGLAAGLTLACHLQRGGDLITAVIGAHLEQKIFELAATLGAKRLGCGALRRVARQRRGGDGRWLRQLIGHELRVSVREQGLADHLRGLLAKPDRSKPAVRRATVAVFARFTHQLRALLPRFYQLADKGDEKAWQEYAVEQRRESHSLLRDIDPKRKPLDLATLVDPNFQAVLAEVAARIHLSMLASTLARLVKARVDLDKQRRAYLGATAGCP